jgi:hypothetical protein
LNGTAEPSGPQVEQPKSSVEVVTSQHRPRARIGVLYHAVRGAD